MNKIRVLQPVYKHRKSLEPLMQEALKEVNYFISTLIFMSHKR
jgi:hypothetical protein